MNELLKLLITGLTTYVYYLNWPNVPDEIKPMYLVFCSLGFALFVLMVFVGFIDALWYALKRMEKVIQEHNKP